MTTAIQERPVYDGDAALQRWMRGREFKVWRERVKSVGGCLHPVHLHGSSEIRDASSGRVISSTKGRIWGRCGTRRAAVCPACAEIYSRDAYQIIASGLKGGKGIPSEVASVPRLFVTLTAPSFGQVHNRPGKRPCSCGRWHPEADPILGTPLDPAAYDYTGAVLWQAHAGQLWHRWTIRLRRILARVGGVLVRSFGKIAQISYAKVAEYQRRGLIHLHSVVRVDGPDGPGSPSPSWLTPAVLADAVREAAKSITLDTVRPDGSPLVLAWGKQVDAKDITVADDASSDDEDQAAADTRIAGYIAKYATKGSGAVETGDRRIRSQADIDYLRVSAHHRAMMQAAWDLGDLPEYESLNLRNWAHMLGFRGHFLTKSRAYSVTFKHLHAERRQFHLDAIIADSGMLPGDLVVVNDWEFVRIGYDSREQMELAAAIGAGLRNRSTTQEE